MKKVGQPEDPTEMTAGRNSLMVAFAVGIADSEMMRMAANWLRDLVALRGMPLDTLNTNPLYAKLMEGTLTESAEQKRVVDWITSMVKSPNERQVGGSHYQSGVQHWDFVSSNEFSYFGGQVTRYATRWQKKNGREDVEKAIHYLEKWVDTLLNPVPTVRLQDFLDSHPEFSEDEREIMRLISRFEFSMDIADLRQVRVHLERLWLAANTPPR